MRALHLFSNHKFTGPADPALVLARGLAEHEVEVLFAAGRAPRGPSGVLELARARGIDVTNAFHLHKHGRPLPTLRDIRRLAAMLKAGRHDLVHAHLPNDHLIAALAARGTATRVVRTLHDATVPRGFRARVALAHTDLLIVASESVARSFRSEFRGGGPEIAVVDPLLDLERFEHRRSAELRGEWHAGEASFVVGVVARMQTHRLFPELIAGFSGVARDNPGLRLVILGRGTNQELVARQPARASGIADQIIFPGYVDNDEYPRYLPCFDALVFLVPGSDGTCRAAREALVSGVPVICSRRGLLPELVEDGVTGLHIEDESPEAIGAAIGRLRADPDLCRRLGAAAAERGRRRFSHHRHVERVAALYREMLAGSPS